MKKIISIILLATLSLALLTACNSEPTPTARPGLSIDELASYTIVYPSDYTEYRMNEVYLLRDAIEHLTGKAPAIANDTAAETEKEIIIGSSDRKTNYSSDIAAFESKLDYIIAVEDNKIVLGGSNFYADMRAICAFMNDYLGYDDIENSYGEPSKFIQGVEKYIYKKPVLTLLGSNFSVSAYTEQAVVRDMAAAHFNMTLIDETLYTYEEFRDFIKWCARYEIFIMIRMNTIKYFDLYVDCPVIYGNMMDEPKLEHWESASEWCKAYIEKYSQYGWKPFINHYAIFDPTYSSEYEEAYIKYFANVLDVFSFDRYLGDMSKCRYDYILATIENSKKKADEYGQEFWYYIEAYNLVKRHLPITKMFRTNSYMALSFDADAIEYFQYGDASPNYTAEGDWSNGSLIEWDYTKNDAYYIAKSVNEDLINVKGILNEYDWLGACVFDEDEYDGFFAHLNDPYDFSDVVTQFNQLVYKDTYLAGCFEKKDGNGYAFTLVNVEPLDGIPYDETVGWPIQIKINGSNATFYKDGKPVDVEKDSNGYYNISSGNGGCWLVTVEK